MGLDLGTTYFKVAVVSSTGDVEAVARRRFPVHHPTPKRAEVPVESVDSMLRDTVVEALSQASRKPKDVEGISYASQANTFALFDSDAKPLTPFLVWTDDRASSPCQTFHAFRKTPGFLEDTGLGTVSSHLLPAKLLWLSRHEPNRWSRTRHILTLSDYVAHTLTGDFVGDTSSIALTGLWNVLNGTPYAAGVETLGVDATRFVARKRPSEQIGTCRGRLGEEIGLHPNAVVAAGALDHYAAAVGCGAGAFADASESTGTVIALLSRTERFEPRQGLIVGPDAIPGWFYCLSFSPHGAELIDWFQENCGNGRSLDDLTDLASMSEPGAAGTLPNTLATGDRRSIARLCVDEESVGVLFRGLLEQAALTLRSFVASQPSPIRSIAATGGGARNDLWLQIKADILNVPVIRASAAEPAALGAAMLAANCTGWIDSPLSAAREWLSVDRRFEPHAQAVKRYRELFARADETP